MSFEMHILVPDGRKWTEQEDRGLEECGASGLRGVGVGDPLAYSPADIRSVRAIMSTTSTSTSRLQALTVPYVGKGGSSDSQRINRTGCSIKIYNNYYLNRHIYTRTSSESSPQPVSN